MKFRIALLGALLSVGASLPAQTTSPNAKSTQSANRMKQQPASSSQQSVTGCVDEQNGHYVLRDIQTSQIVNLQSPSSDDDSLFARFVGHQVQANGTKESSNLKVAHIAQVADMCGTGK